MMPVATLVLLVLPLAQSPASSPLTPGVRVRVTVREAGGTSRTHVGPLRTFDGEALTLTAGDSAQHSVSLARPSITRVEVSRGRRGNAGRGALLGAVLGLAVVALSESGCEGECEPRDNYGLLVAGATVGGAAVGAGIGSLMRSERWESLPWAAGPPRRASVPVVGPLSLAIESPGGRPRAAAVGLSLGF
jgi:hypothetical protein